MWNKNFFVTMFYVFTLFLASSRIIFFIGDFLTAYHWDVYYRAMPYYNVTRDTSFYAKAALGVFQMGTMNELSIKMKQSAGVISDKSAQRWIIANQVLSLLLAAGYLTVGYYDH